MPWSVVGLLTAVRAAVLVLKGLVPRCFGGVDRRSWCPYNWES